MALRDQPYIPLYVSDFMTDEALLECSAESVGVYIKLMCVMHKSKEYGTFSLKQKDKQNPLFCQKFAKPFASTLLEICYTFALKLDSYLPYSVDVISRGLLELIESDVLKIDGDKILQRRMVRDFALSNTRSEAGQKGGFAKANKLANSVAKSKQNTVIANEYTNENEIEEEIGSQEGKFLKFWDSYPCHMDQIKAEVEFSKLNPSDELFKAILSSLEKWKKCDRWTEESGKYIPYPSTWLKGKRWKDDVPAPTAKKPDKPKQNFEGVTYSEEYFAQRQQEEDLVMELVGQGVPYKKAMIEASNKIYGENGEKQIKH